MKKSNKLMFFVVAAVVVIFTYAGLQSQSNTDPFGAITKRAELELKIAQLRVDLKDKGCTFTVGVNPAMQYTIEQLCNFKPELGPMVQKDDPIAFEAVKPPAPSDTYYIAAYTSVKDQGSCGSCWAFSTAGMFESVLLKKGISTDLSEQWLVSCNTDGWGCNGGWFANNYYLNPGAVLESCFRYKAIDAPCKTGCPYVYIATGQGSASNVAAIKDAIKVYGAVSCAVTVTTPFQAYTGGVFNYNSTAQTNHAVVLVGWDDTLGSAGCWRMKNSWGRSWGDSGMMWIEYGCSNIGSGGNYLKY